MVKRSGKFYRTNEAVIMERLGFKPTKGSGSGWVEKEDGESEFALCQLKSTDANSIRVQLKDLHTLEYHATVSHKMPVFAVQFLGTGDVYLLVRPEHVADIPNGLRTPGFKPNVPDVVIDTNTALETVRTGPEVKSSATAREAFNQQWQEQFEKGSRSAV